MHAHSVTISSEARRPSFARRLSKKLESLASEQVASDDEVSDTEVDDLKAMVHTLEAWQMEAAAVDRSVRILPGVKKLMGSIPDGRYAVATSGARTYGQFI